MNIFNLLNNTFAYPNIFCVIFLISLGNAAFFLRRTKANFIFSLLTLSAAIWQLGTAFAIMSVNAETAFFWTKFSYIGVTLIPVTMFHFVVALLNIPKGQKYVPMAYFVAIFIFIPLSLSGIFLSGAYKFPWGFWFKATALHPLYILSYSSLFFLNLILLFLKYRSSTGIDKERIKYLLIALFISYGGAVDYITDYGYNIFPVGYIFVVICLVVIAYAIVYHRLMDIEVVIKRGFVYSALIALIVGIYTLTVFVSQEIFGNIIGLKWLLAIIGSALIAVGFKPLEIAFTNFTDKYFFKAKYDYHKTLKELSRGMAELTNLDRLTKLIARIVMKNMKLEGAMVLVFDYNNNNFRAISAQGNMKEFKDTALQRENPIVKYFDQTENIIIKDDLIHELENKKVISSYRDTIKDIARQMDKYKAILCVPSKIKDKLIGFIMLSEKKSQDMYSSEDIMLFQTLAPQAAVAIKNAMSYDEIRKDLEKEHGKVEAIEKQLERSERLASLGTLAAGVAHEIRNPMQALRLKAEGIAEKADNPAYVKEASGDVIRNADRVLTITKEMLDLSKQTEAEKKPLNINDMLENVLRFIPAGNNIKLVKELNPVPQINGNANQLSQVAINIIQNAVKAMPKGGTLTIKTFKDDAGVNVEFSDTGEGIPKENLEKIFDPFFTTHAESTGLGLSISYKIVREHGGSIKVSSEAGKGSIFTVSLPLSS